MLLDVIRIRHQKAMVESVQLRLQLFLRCLQTSEILVRELLAKAQPGSLWISPTRVTAWLD